MTSTTIRSFTQKARLKVVFPESVRMLVEVKTGLSKKDLEGALENIRTAKQMNLHLNGVIFACESPRTETVVKNLRKYSDSANLPLKYAPIAILLLKRGVIIHRWPGTEKGGGENPYNYRVSNDKTSGEVIAFLLLLFFDVLMQGVWGGASIENMQRKLLAESTVAFEETRPLQPFTSTLQQAQDTADSV